MYLKQVELQGFKSFATKSTFEFHNGITCIVGPNGSGKSNISDAVRWVLGEQSARQLRGRHMQDVIFSGTQTRRPVSFASVSLLLDNADHALPVDFEEVRVTRRIYRSGESEYLLNGSACRLRDIQELFYDTGVGKEGYSLIGQGQIEKILNGKPQDRRELFDEAAGIVKFKRRKAAALKKLEHEREDLIRVNDILTELERRVGPLKSQSEKAKKYLRLREMRKEADVQLFALQTEQAAAQKAVLEESLSHLEEELSEAREKYETGKDKTDRIEAQQKAQERRIEELQTLVNESALQKNTLSHQVELIAAQSRADELSGAHYAKRLADIEASAAQKADERSQDAEKKADLQTQMEEALCARAENAAELSEIDETIRLAQARIDEINGEILALMEEKTQAEGRHRHYDTLLQETRLRKEALQEEEAAAQDLIRQKRADAEVQNDALEAARHQLRDEREALERAQDTLEELTGERNALRDHLEEIRHTLAKAQSQRETLRNMAERYEGYGQSIRKVMQKHHPGVIGVVADLLQVDQKYETAVETALGGSIQNIVTKDAGAAREMIDYLKKERLGRATFLPLTDVAGRRAAQETQALREPGVIGTADTLVTCEEAYRGIVSSLLGGILVTDNVDHALAIARKYRHALRIVTLEGEYLRPGGSMTGGAFKNGSNLLGRRREQEALTRRIREAEADRSKTSARLDEITQLRADLREQIVSAQDAIAGSEIAENAALMELKRLSDEAASQETRIGEIREAAGQLDARLAESGAQHEDTSAAIRQIEEKRGALEAENAQTADRLQAAMQERSVLSERAEQLMLSVQSIEQNMAFLQENMDRLSAEEAALDEEAQGIRRTQEAARERAASSTDRSDQILASIEEAGRQGEQAQADLEEARHARDLLNASYRAFFEEREALTQDIARLEKEEFRLNDLIARLAESQEKQDEYIWEEYGLTRREAIAAGQNPEASETALKKQTKELTAEIKSLGNVNVNAIEEYQEVGERYELMTGQKADIEEAAENLEKMIANLETGIRRQFREQFALIQAEFQKVFSELFGGGHGALELVQGEDDLETGIDIIAQPPGKKLQNMMQLSGGEKALTAICLLFAIQNLKPSPFCILDEIEAALDEPNVDRFAQYLKRLSGRTQFIVITHRRGSMAVADRLYGITMQEKGVSAQVSVELAEAQLAEEEAQE